MMMKKLYTIVLIVSLAPGKLLAQDNYFDYKQNLNHKYEEWSKRQDWKYNYIEWRKKRDQAYEDWKKQSGLDKDDFNPGWEFNDPFAEITQSNSQIDSLEQVIAHLEEQRLLSDSARLEIEQLQNHINDLRQQQEIYETIGDFKVWAVIVGVSDYGDSSANLSYWDDDAYLLYLKSD